MAETTAGTIPSSIDEGNEAHYHRQHTAYRLTRNAEGFDRLMKICGKSKIKISLYTGGELDLSTASGGFYGFMETGRSWYESAIRSQRVKDAVERNARAGKRTGGGSRRSATRSSDRTSARTWIAWVVLRAGESSTEVTPAESPIGTTPTAPQA